jgi:hypothetical protein
MRGGLRERERERERGVLKVQCLKNYVQTERQRVKKLMRTRKERKQARKARKLYGKCLQTLPP